MPWTASAPFCGMLAECCSRTAGIASSEMLWWRGLGWIEADFERRHAEVDQAWEKDEIGADEYLRHTVFFEPRNFTQDEFLDAMYAESTLLADSAMGILREVSASEEYVLATVNNESRAMNEFRLVKFGLLDQFDAFFSSCYLGVRKPDRKIYQVALDVLQREPERVVFIDDRAENVAAATSLGIHGVRYEGSEQLGGELVRLGVLPARELRVHEA